MKFGRMLSSVSCILCVLLVDLVTGVQSDISAFLEADERNVNRLGNSKYSVNSIQHLNFVKLELRSMSMKISRF